MGLQGVEAMVVVRHWMVAKEIGEFAGATTDREDEEESHRTSYAGGVRECCAPMRRCRWGSRDAGDLTTECLGGSVDSKVPMVLLLSGKQGHDEGGDMRT